MITTANRIFVNPEYADLFEENFRNRAGLVDRMPGFVSNQLLRPVNPGDPYIVLTVWESRAHLRTGCVPTSSAGACPFEQSSAGDVQRSQ